MNAQVLQNQMETYLALRSALGFKDTARKALLQDFVRYVIDHGVDRPIRAKVAVDWACSASSRGAAGQACRLSAARGFLSHLKATISETEVPDSGLVASIPRRLPYLFSQEQIAQLIEYAATLKPRRSLHPHTYSTILGLLSSTGLRVGEAIRLKINDVELGLDPPRLQIRETKFRKSRIVPLHSTTAKRLEHYAKLREQMGYAALSDAFFVSEEGKHLDYHSLWIWFKRVTRRLGMISANDGRAPSLHSFRHVFAIQRLTLWCREGAPVQELIPHLSVYLGHVRPEYSYWYLTATPALLLTAAESFQRYADQGAK